MMLMYQQDKSRREEAKLGTLLTIGQQFGYSQPMLEQIDGALKAQKIGSLPKDDKGQFKEPPPSLEKMQQQFYRDHPQAFVDHMTESTQKIGLEKQRLDIANQRYTLEAGLKQAQLATEAQKLATEQTKAKHGEDYSGYILRGGELVPMDYGKLTTDMKEGDQALTYTSLNDQAKAITARATVESKKTLDQIRGLKEKENELKVAAELRRALGGELANTAKVLGKDHPLTKSIVATIAKENGVDLSKQPKGVWQRIVDAAIGADTSEASPTGSVVPNQAVQFISARKGMDPAQILDEAGQYEASQGLVGFRDQVGGFLANQVGAPKGSFFGGQ